MSSPVIPATPAAPAAPAAVSAPQSSPAPSPAPVAAPAAPSTPATPAAGAPPAPNGPQPPARPNPGDFGNAIDHYQAEVTWKQEIEAFKAENPGVAIPDELAAPPAEAAPAAEAPKPAEEAPPAAEAAPPAADEEPFLVKDEPAVTPQALNDLLKGDETLKAAIEANPAAKGAIMKLAREHAELSQFKGIFPNKESAEFAKKEANSKVALRTQFQMAETPEQMAGAFDSFMNEFAVIDPATGKQAVDAQGQPVYGDDLYAFGEHVVSRYTDTTLSEVEERLKTGQYASEAEKTRDEDLKIALQIINEDLRPSNAPKADPDLSTLAPDVRAQVQARLDEAKRIESDNAAKAAGAGKQNRQQTREKGTTEFFQRSAGRMWPQVDNIIDKLRKAGAVIPDWQLTTPLPGTQVSAFQNEVGSQIQSFIKADPYIANHMMSLELQYLNNPTTETMQQRVAYFDGVLQSKDETGRSLLNRIVSGIVHKYGTSVANGTQTVADPPAASKEPRQGGVVRPQALTADEAWKQAESALAKEVNGWQNMTDSEQMSQIFTRQRQLLTAK